MMLDKLKVMLDLSNGWLLRVYLLECIQRNQMFGVLALQVFSSIHLSLSNSSIDDILLTICYIIIITLFGIVTTSIAWEVIARECPYGDMSPALAAHAILSGQLLAIPDHCPPRLGEIMLSCWHLNPQDRPSFYQIYEQLESLRA